MYDQRNLPDIRPGYVATPSSSCPVDMTLQGDNAVLYGNRSGVPVVYLADGTEKPLALARTAPFFTALLKTAAALPSCVYDNGTAGVGATLTASANGALGTVGGVTAGNQTLGDTFVVDQQVSTFQNGLYTLTSKGGVSSKWVLTRLAGFDTAATIIDGAQVAVQQGTYADQIYDQTDKVTTVGTDAIEFALSATAVSFTAVKSALNAANSSVAMNSQKFTGLAAGSAAGDSLRYEQGGMLVSGSNTGTIGAATKYLSPPAGAGVNASQVMLGVVTRTGVVRNLRAALGTAPGGSDTVAFTVQKSSDNGSTWSDTTLTCTISASATTASDTTHAPAVAAGDYLAVKMVSSAGTAAAPAAGFEIL